MPKTQTAPKKHRVAPHPAGSNHSSKSSLKNSDLLKLNYFMRLTREFEDAVYRMYQQGKIVGGAYSGRGNEATAVASALALEPDDYLFPLHRDMGAHLVKGQTLRNLFLQYLGREEGPARARDGTGHYVDAKLRIYGNVSHLGAMIPVAVGVALASKIKKERTIAVTYIGDGGSNVGEVHEGLAMASVQRLPFVLIIENNQYAYSTPISKQFSAKNLSDRALGYGIPGVTVDGTDVLAMYHACKEAYDRARKGGGPSIIESRTMRMMGHAAHDNAWYVPKKLLDEWKKKDPVELFEKHLLNKGILTKASLAAMVKEILAIIDESQKYAEERQMPSTPVGPDIVYAS